MNFYYYQLKSEYEKQIYRVLRNAVEEHKESLIIPHNVSGADISRVFLYLLMDYPDYFWTKGDFTLRQNINTEKQNCCICLHYLYDETECQYIGNEIQKSLMEIAGAVEGNTCQQAIVRDIVTWFRNNVTYSAMPGIDQTIYSALVMKKSVCMGISKAITLVLRLFGIESIVVIGSLFQRSIHAWNMVYLDNIWYHLDMTVGYECFDRLWSAHGIQNRKSLILVKNKELEETHSLREGIIYPLELTRGECT